MNKIKAYFYRKRIQKAVNSILNDPPVGDNVKYYYFPRLTNDQLFAVSVEASHDDIECFCIDADKGEIRAYSISAFEDAKRRLKEMQDYEQELTEGIYEWLTEVKGEKYLTKEECYRIVHQPLTNDDVELVKKYLCSGYKQKYKEKKKEEQ